jgi:hypothetical protein
MAGSAPLTSRPRTPLLALLAVVLLIHVLALQWLARQLEHSAVLRPMATPMFTRLLVAQTPAAVPAPPARPAARARIRRSGITSIAAPKAKAAGRAASALAPAPAPAAAAEDTVLAAGESAAQSSPNPSQAASTPDAPVAPAASAPAPADSTASTPSLPASEPASVSASAAGDPAALDSWPADTRLNYLLGGQFRSGDLHGSARVQWQRQGSRYETRVDIDVTLLASLVLTSQGEVTVQGLAPKAYEESRRNGPRGVRIGDETITLTDGRGVPRPDGVQDTASQFVELSHRFATGQEPLVVGRTVSFWMARPGGVDLWTYDIVGREILQTPQLGAVEAFHLKPRPIANARGNITAEMWFAPSLQYLPVRIRVSMGEATYVDLMVDNIEQR